MLQAHPRIAIAPENRFLLPVYFGRHEFGDLGRVENRRRLADAIVQTRRDMRNYGLDPGEISDRITAGCPTVGSAIGLVLRAYADRFGKVRWGDKRPEYRRYTWLLQRLFPDAQFVHLIRDGRDCVESLKRMPWWTAKNKTTHQAVQTWIEAMEYAERARRQLPAGTFFELRYERLVSEPEKQLTALCEFLGEPFDEAMLRPRSVADQVVPEYKTHHDKTRQDVSSAYIGGFTGGLERWELELCEAVMGDRLIEHGYPLTGAAAPDPAHLEEYHRVEQWQQRRLRRERERDQDRQDVQPVADVPEMVGDEGRFAELEGQVACLTRERDALDARMQRMRSSRSWRWTAPLRSVEGAARRRRNRP